MWFSKLNLTKNQIKNMSIKITELFASMIIAGIVSVPIVENYTMLRDTLINEVAPVFAGMNQEAGQPIYGTVLPRAVLTNSFGEITYTENGTNYIIVVE